MALPRMQTAGRLAKLWYALRQMATHQGLRRWQWDASRSTSQIHRSEKFATSSTLKAFTLRSTRERMIIVQRMQLKEFVVLGVEWNWKALSSIFNWSETYKQIQSREEFVTIGVDSIFKQKFWSSRQEKTLIDQLEDQLGKGKHLGCIALRSPLEQIHTTREQTVLADLLRPIATPLVVISWQRSKIFLSPLWA